MKKWLSLVLAVMMILAAVPALAAVPTAPAFFGTVKEWKEQANPEVLDYVTDITEIAQVNLPGLAGIPATHSTLRAGNGITELVVEVPVETEEETEEIEYAEKARFQYADNGLAIKVGEQVILVDVNDILELIPFDVDYTLDAINADAALVKKLVAHFVLEVLQPTITTNADNGSLNLHIDVNQDQLVERLPAFLENISGQEAEINKLLKKYGLKHVAAWYDINLSLAGIKEAWAKLVENDAVPAVSLLADASIVLPTEENPFQIGVAGVLTFDANEINITAEYLPTKTGFLAFGNVSGVVFGQAFDEDVKITRLEKSVELELSSNALIALDVKLTDSWGDGHRDITLDANLAGQKAAAAYTRTFNEATGDLDANLAVTMPGATAPRDIVTLDASVQDRGITGDVKLLGHKAAHFTYTPANLYHRIQVIFTGILTQIGSVDAWLFPQGNNAYRFRVDLQAGKHYLLNGSINPNTFNATYSEVGGKKWVDLTLVRIKEENQSTITATAALSNEADELIDVDAVMTLEDRIPTSFDGNYVRKTVDGEMKDVRKVSWLPGHITYINGINNYNVDRIVDTADELTYSITCNTIKEMGRISGTRGARNELTFSLAWDKDLYSATITPVEPEAPAEGPVVIGRFDGQWTEEGQLDGLIYQPEEVTVLKIQPIDVENALVVNASYVVKNVKDIPAKVQDLIVTILK